MRKMKKLLSLVICVVVCAIATTSAYASCVNAIPADTPVGSPVREAYLQSKLENSLPVVLTFDDIIGTEWGIKAFTECQFDFPETANKYVYRYGTCEAINERIDYYKEHPEETLYDEFYMNCIHYGKGFDSYVIHVTVDDIGLKKDYLVYSHCNGHV